MAKRTFLVTVEDDTKVRAVCFDTDRFDNKNHGVTRGLHIGTVGQHIYDVNGFKVEEILPGKMLDPEYDHLEFTVAIDPLKIDKAVFYNSQDTELVEVSLNDRFESFDHPTVSIVRKRERS